MNTREKSCIVVSVSAVAIAAGLGGAYLFLAKDTAPSPSGTSVASASKSSTAPASVKSTNTTAATTVPVVTSGEYSASTSYDVPKGFSNNLTTKVTVEDGIITAVSAQNSASDHESERYIQDFESALERVVVGKEIASLSLSRIGGASLTTDAFTQTLDTIARQIKA